MNEDLDVYKQNGYKDRTDYLKCLADDFGIEWSIVNCVAEMLGENEDFDGLVTALGDF